MAETVDTRSDDGLAGALKLRAIPGGGRNVALELHTRSYYWTGPGANCMSASAARRADGVVRSDLFLVQPTSRYQGSRPSR